MTTMLRVVSPNVQWLWATGYDVMDDHSQYPNSVLVLLDRLMSYSSVTEKCLETFTLVRKTIIYQLFECFGLVPYL